ncbi:MAG: ABC transporter substrate-binding protein [Burkholderiales bacterium]|nr:ABC transporter substrate-binding protein [Burkholderiales bacterium]
MPATRIASLVPSITELLIALGLRQHVVARTGFCIHPADDVRDIPKVGGTKDVNLDKLRSLRPSHVIVNVDENRLDTVDAIRAWPKAERPQVIVTHPNSPEDNLALIDQLVHSNSHFENHPVRGFLGAGVRPSSMKAMSWSQCSKRTY